jgi:hypothetical protein
VSGELGQRAAASRRIFDETAEVNGMHAIDANQQDVLVTVSLITGAARATPSLLRPAVRLNQVTGCGYALLRPQDMLQLLMLPFAGADQDMRMLLMRPRNVS